MFKPTASADGDSLDREVVATSNTSLMQIFEARSAAARYLEQIDQELKKFKPDFDHAFWLIKRLKNQISLARTIEATATIKRGLHA